MREAGNFGAGERAREAAICSRLISDKVVRCRRAKLKHRARVRNGMPAVSDQVVRDMAAVSLPGTDTTGCDTAPAHRLGP
ncbi:hypothetical protein GCM10022376_25500 [Yimella lutea]